MLLTKEQILELRKTYYSQGYLQLPFPNNQSLQKMLALLKDLDTKPPQNQFKWTTQFEGSVDLDPPVQFYDPFFVDFVIEQDLLNILQQICGEPMVLSGLTLRKAYPGSVYMGWHRDTYTYSNGATAGLMPPTHKIMLYPALGELPETQLDVLPRSQIRVFRNKYIDRLQPEILPTKAVQSSDTHFLMFNSALFHSTANVKRKNGCFRMMYYFINPLQFKEHPDDHLEKLYHERLTKFLSSTNSNNKIAQAAPTAPNKNVQLEPQ